MYESSLRRALGALVPLCLILLLSTTGTAVAQEPYTIQGRVVDANTQQPLANVSVQLRPTQIGTLTNSEGRFTLIARVQPGEYTLRVSLIGRGESVQDLTLGDTRVVSLGDVPLEARAIELEEIVVTGIGVEAERRQVPNTVASISGERVNDAPAATAVDQALQGKIAGAVISQNTGQPGGGVSIRLRGTSSILGGAEPLIVIDGVIVENNADALISLGANAGRGGAALSNRLSDIAPGDIESIEVLKGAAAAALYGSRANSGVIQIFTREGQQGEPRITFRTQAIANNAPDRYELLEAPFASPGDVTYGPATEVGEPIDRFDYQDEIFRTGYGTQNDLSISGGAEGTTYYLSGSWTSQEGVIRATGHEKINARAKLSQRISDWLEVTGSANYIQANTNYVPEGEQTQGVLTTLIFTPTSFNPAFDPELQRYPYSPVIQTNPLDVLENWEATANVDRFVGSVQANMTPLPNLNIDYIFGIDDSQEENTYLQPAFAIGPSFTGELRNPVRSVQRYNNDLVATVDAEVSPALQFTTTGGFRHTFDRTNIIRAAAIGLNPGQTTVGAGGATPSASQSISEITTVGGFVQERVSVGDRLFVTGGLNVEASSAFGENERWQLFPRIGASYVVSEEDFWADSPMGNVFSTLRLRAAYGETGGQPPGAYIRFNNYINTQHAGEPGLIPSGLAGNPDLRPERQREWEGGLEAGLFENRVSLEFTYYDQYTDDLVLSIPLPLSSGYTSQYQNIGAISNRGVELSLNTLNVQRPGFDWNSRVTLAANRNRVEQLAGEADTIPGAAGYPNYIMEGQPVGVFYGSVYPRDAQGDIILGPNGIPRRARVLNPATGDSVVAREIIGNPNPDFTASLSNTFTVGESLQLEFLLDGRFGNDVANFSRRISEYFGAAPANAREATGEVPAGYYTLNLERHLLYEEFIEDGSFVKLREIALRYRFGQPLVDRLGFGADGLTLSLAGRNLYTWTDYGGLDPEINLFASNTVSRGVDFATTPIPRTFVLGLTFNF